jgi:uncharacterized Ntn-hydrolase superfamily protein
MRRVVLACLFVAAGCVPSFATWSVLAVDRATRAVVIASATCVPQARFATMPARGLMDIQAIVVPGRGIAAAQASVDATRANQRLIYDELAKGRDPAAILETLKTDPAIETRQFGILDTQGRHAAFTGSANGARSLHEQGTVPGTAIQYSIQGNILRSDAVVHAAGVAFVRASGSLTDRVMAAMEAADLEGGDARCSCDSQPQLDAPCDRKTAHVAYLLRADATDKNGASYNDGDYALYIAVTDEDIKPTENANPVRTLRQRYDEWKRSRHGR